MPVIGIGGVFFRSADPGALRKWYGDHLGIDPVGYDWPQTAGPAMIMPFSATTDYFPADKSWMLNLRVAEIDAMIEKLRADGIEVATDPSWDTPETGRFAHILDPEGNKIELWQPPSE